MNSLTEFKDFLTNQKIKIDSFNGWELKVGKDIWTMFNGVFYANGLPQSTKDKAFFSKYKKEDEVTDHDDSKSIETRKWRGISSRNYQ